MAETAGAVPATMPGPFRGRAPGKSETLYHRFGPGQLKGCGFSDFRTAANLNQRPRSTVIWSSLLSRGHFAATELTVMVSPSKVPVTVAFLPACWSSVARAALSVVFNV
jgi:hypothetical protein